MEMEREIEWKTTEEEEEDMGSGLKTKQRNRGKMGKQNNEEEKGVNGEEEKSVYFEAEEGAWKCRHCPWTYHLSGPRIDLIQKHEGICQVAMDSETLTQLAIYFDSPIKGSDLNNVTVALKSEEVDNSIAEKNLQNGKATNGAKDFNDQDNIIVVEENKNPSNVVMENGSGSHNSEEVRGNRIRSENEIQQWQQVEPDEPSGSSNFIVAEYDVERVLEEQETHHLYCPNCHSCITKRVILRKRKRTPKQSQSDFPPEKVQVVPEVAQTETEIHEEAVFRCLECFTFFIPRESGFNIFRIFGKKDKGKSLQRPETVPASNVNWFSSLFASGSSKNNVTEAEVPLLAETSPTSSEDPSSGRKDQSLLKPTTGGGDLGEKGTSSGMNNAGPSTGVTGSQVQGDKLSYPATSISKDPSAEESHPNDGITGSRTQGDKQRYPATAVSQDPSSGEYPNGVMGNQSQGVKPSCPAISASEGITDKPNAVAKPPFLEELPSMLPAYHVLLPEININKPISEIKLTPPVGTSEIDQNTHRPETTPAIETCIDIRERAPEESRRGRDWDILKSIVYGGLIESITSLSVVSSAAGSGSSALNICALGLANLIGGLFLISHDLAELKTAHNTESSTNQRDETSGLYWEKLGKRQNFRRHAFVSILSYIIFGLLPPVIYAFAFRHSDNKENKIIAVAASSLFCVALLAIGKAHVKPEKDYFKSLFYYLSLAVPASGLSYAAGVMIDRLLNELGLFDPGTVSPAPPSSVELLRFGSGAQAWAAL